MVAPLLLNRMIRKLRMSDGFAEFVKDCLDSFGQVTVRKMFGGHGVYLDGVIVGLIADDCFYLKASKTTQHEFEKIGSKPFEYARDGKAYKMSYWSVDEGMLESPEDLRFYVELAHQASLETKK